VQLKWLNLLEPYRAEIQDFIDKPEKAKPHEFFHHLNSSQAFAFNLFIPFFLAGQRTASALAAALGVTGGVIGGRVEVVPDPKERTNLDAAWRTQDGSHVFCEVKLTEADFGPAAADTEHRDKLRDIYLDVLTPHVDDVALTERFFFAHYQLLRNVWHLVKKPASQLVLLYPRANAVLAAPIARVIAHLNVDVAGRIVVAHVEDVLAHLGKQDLRDVRLQFQVSALAEKYLP
jgi:hypothetical protein